MYAACFRMGPVWSTGSPVQAELDTPVAKGFRVPIRRTILCWVYIGVPLFGEKRVPNVSIGV